MAHGCRIPHGFRLSPVALTGGMGPLRLHQSQRSANTGGRNAIAQPRYEVCEIQTCRISTMAPPEVTRKHGNADPCAEDVTGASGNEKVEPVIEEKIEDTDKVEREEGPDNVEKVEGPEVEPGSLGKEQAQIKLEDLNKEALLRLVEEYEALLATKEKQLAELKGRVLRNIAELENVKERLRREAERTKKYDIQEFAKSLLDVADNLERAIKIVPEHVWKALADDQSDVAKYLKSLLEGVMLTENQLLKIFKNFGIERFDPAGEPFDPNRHLALFEVDDPTKEPGTVAVVVKAGYMLHDRILQPAEVGVVKSWRNP